MSYEYCVNIKDMAKKEAAPTYAGQIERIGGYVKKEAKKTVKPAGIREERKN